MGDSLEHTLRSYPPWGGVEDLGYGCTSLLSSHWLRTGPGDFRPAACPGASPRATRHRGWQLESRWPEATGVQCWWHLSQNLAGRPSVRSQSWDFREMRAGGTCPALSVAWSPPNCSLPRGWPSTWAGTTHLSPSGSSSCWPLHGKRSWVVAMSVTLANDLEMISPSSSHEFASVDRM